MVASGSILGNPVRRVEDPRILRGDAKYFDDLTPAGTAHLAFVRSTMAHARLPGGDTADGEAMPGVIAVHTKDSLLMEPVQGFVMLPPVFSRPPLADGVVRLVGDMIAVVVAETRAQAVDAAELVVVDYDPLPTVVDSEAALEADAPQLFPDHGSNVAIEFNFGEDATILEGADVVVQGRFVNQRAAPAPMEANGILIEPTPEGGLLATVPTQGPFGVRDPLAAAVGLEPDAAR